MHEWQHHSDQCYITNETASSVIQLYTGCNGHFVHGEDTLALFDLHCRSLNCKIFKYLSQNTAFKLQMLYTS